MTQKTLVLYAEDNRADADLTRTHFAEHAPDIELEIADTAKQCFARLRARTFDALLLDNRLPDMDGTAVKPVDLDVLVSTVQQMAHPY